MGERGVNAGVHIHGAREVETIHPAQIAALTIAFLLGAGFGGLLGIFITAVFLRAQ